MKMKMKMKNRSHRCHLNRPSSRHEHKYSNCEKGLSIMMITCVKKNLSNT